MKLSDPILIRKDPMLLQKVEEMASDFWWIEGYFPTTFLGNSLSSNAYLIKDGRNLLLVDNGLSPLMQEKILALVGSYAGQADRFYMTLTQGHFDHAGNNELIDEVPINETHFVLNEREIPMLESLSEGVLGLLKRRSPYYRVTDDLSTGLPFMADLTRLSPDMAELVATVFLRLAYAPVQLMTHKVEPLRMADVQTYVFGGVNLYGWPLGRLIIIPDCSHSPGHCCVYDPQNKIMLTGDVTVEVNPVDPTGSLNALIRYNTLFKQMAAEGNIETVGDGHRSKSCWQKFLDSFPPGLWDEVAAGDFVVGKDNCIRFFEQFENFHRGQRQAVIETHRRLGTVSVPEIADAVLQRNDTAVNVMKAVHTAMAGFPSPWRCLCAAVVREQGCRRIDREGGIPLFEPPEAIIDDPSVEPLGVPEHAWG